MSLVNFVWLLVSTQFVWFDRCMSTELTKRMPKMSAPLPDDRRRRLERLALRARTAQAELRHAIAEERGEGVSLRAIAEATGFTPEGVAKIAARSHRGEGE